MTDMHGFSVDLAELRRRKATGHQYVQLVLQRDRPPRTRRVRIIPGCLGVVIGETANVSYYLVDVLLDDLIPALEKRSKA